MKSFFSKKIVVVYRRTMDLQSECFEDKSNPCTIKYWAAESAAV